MDKKRGEKERREREGDKANTRGEMGEERRDEENKIEKRSERRGSTL
jgi:hypothetical protein